MDFPGFPWISEVTGLVFLRKGGLLCATCVTGTGMKEVILERVFFREGDGVQMEFKILNWLVATQKFFIFTPKIAEDSHFDEYFSDGLKPPTSEPLFFVLISYVR